VESSRDPMGNPQGSGRFTSDVGRVQNEKVGLHRCDVSRERDDKPKALGRVGAGYLEMESPGHVVDESDGSP
jgi:hypothetical protein